MIVILCITIIKQKMAISVDVQRELIKSIPVQDLNSWQTWFQSDKGHSHYNLYLTLHFYLNFTLLFLSSEYFSFPHIDLAHSLLGLHLSV